ncbi:transcriptional regulator, GntR family [Beutenbergia cavernae DSM 12333]|uniref:Transcriptional regulator, GntR family n=1 Tax=Beutenbergia cavernae (strain ATCC BAA-8 / DSM 12333 / CCUG 43141 / JCM 11478 / NBRC 16432 / NCIMB 13614 / HKI 0122) TaxID=471853 RepID=C5C670_BEUC1|nr:GntR family transcriptional regulator [Beutenbergia cavernae]ACQ82428.1 transcriptional regulator, GntR family [Beutenbergia cavernae DSM 12333]
MAEEHAVIQVALDRASPVPLYFQLAEQLTSAITDGHAQPGDPFENEVAMSERLGLSRPTVRRAIHHLVDQGLLVRKRGLGTFVASRRVHRRVSKGSLYEDLSIQGRHPSTEVLKVASEQYPKAATALELDPGTELLALRRLRFADGEPLAIMQNWLPPRHSSITQEQLEARGLYAVLRDHGVGSVVAHQSVSARLPTAEERALLKISSRLPVIAVSRTAFDPSGAPVEHAEHVYRSDGYTIDLVLEEN